MLFRSGKGKVMDRIVFLDRETFAPQIGVRRPYFAHAWTEYGRTAPTQGVERLKDARIVIDNKVPLTREILSGLPDLTLIAMAVAGYDCVDTAACRDCGITLSNIRGYAVHTVPEHAFAPILALKRALVAYREEVRAGAWQAAGQFCFFSHPIHDLHGSNLVIIGAGSTGGIASGGSIDIYGNSKRGWKI